MGNAIMQQVMPLKHALPRQSDDLRARIKAKCFLSAIVFSKKN